MDNSSILDFCSTYALKEYKKIEKYKKMDMKQVIKISKGILKEIDTEYYEIFKRMLKEQNCDNPVIYILKSQNKIHENESNICGHEIFFYSTETEADIYVLLHEFTHYLTNRKNSYKNDKNNKKYNEILPFLMEHIVSNYLGEDNYLKIRYNETIFNSKLIMVKEGLKRGEDIATLFKKYHVKNKDKDKIIDEIYYSKTYNYDEELRYVYGYIYSEYYSLDNPISNYRNLVEEYTLDRNIILPKINSNNKMKARVI